jgi:hypothetical protein
MFIAKKNTNRLRFGPHFVAELNSERGLGLAYTHHFWWFGVDEDLAVAKEVRRIFIRYGRCESVALMGNVSGNGGSIVLANGVTFTIYESASSRTHVVYSVPGMKPLMLDASFPGADLESALWALARKYPDKVTG